MFDRFNINQNKPHMQFTTSNESQTVSLKHLNIAIHSGIRNAFGEIMHSLSK